MPFIPAPNVAKVECIYTSASEFCENVYHVLGTSAWTATSLLDLANVFSNWENVTAKLLRNVQCSMQEVRCTDESSSTGPVVTTGAAHVGTVGGAPLPNNVTLAIKAETGLRGRSYRGRIYWIGLSESQLNGNSQGVTSAVNTSLVAAMNTLLYTTFPNGGHMVVTSYRHDNAPRSSAVSTPIVNWDTTDGTIDSQRRRLPLHNVHR